MIDSFVAVGARMSYIPVMEETEALSILSALAQATRLKVVILLGGVEGRGMASGDIADAVGVPRHLMSAHLAILGRAGLVTTSKDGRTVSYSVCRPAIQRLNGYLKEMAEIREPST